MARSNEIAGRAEDLGFSTFHMRTGGYSFKKGETRIQVQNLNDADAFLDIVSEAQGNRIAQMKHNTVVELAIHNLQTEYNAAINYAIELGNEGVNFLRIWREGDWETIANEFPDFDLGDNKPQKPPKP